MTRLHPFRTLLLAGALLLVSAPAALAGTLSFTAPQQLPHGDPNAKPFQSGGEPSIAFDPNGDGHVYVTAPQGIPAVAGAVLTGGSQTGVGYWASADHGLSWPVSGLTGTLNGGGDSDVAVLQDHTVLVADLEAADAAICISTDFAHSFPSCANGITSNHQGPEDDREWLTVGKTPNVVYLTYHDFAAGYPIIEQSTDGGHTFLPCANLINPSGPAAQTYTPQGGTLVSKPVVGADGTLYVEFSTPDPTASPVGAPLDHLYMAVLPQGQCTTSPVPNYVIYQNPGADLARIFQATAIDGGGRLYVLAAGLSKAGDTGSNIYLFTSSDGGKTWSTHPQINPTGLPANVFPTLAGGPHSGQAILGWFGTGTSNDPNNVKDQWRYYAAATYDGGSTFDYTTVTPDVIHYGQICTQGIFCTSGRDLADFASAAIDPATGCAALAIPGDPYNRPDISSSQDNGTSSAYVARQSAPAGCFSASNAGTTASSKPGSPSRRLIGQRVASRHRRARHHRRARRHRARHHRRRRAIRPRFTG